MSKTSIQEKVNRTQWNNNQDWLNEIVLENLLLTNEKANMKGLYRSLTVIKENRQNISFTHACNVFNGFDFIFLLACEKTIVSCFTIP